ncbi:stress responsive A/B barrel domain-containing protein [Ascobolus immersus RN42]|uniref:Stress responsive A/B barrel domain-containing protein n=1 Tax=Ascobolus immersus RN42 TaxID=1160509 RepID=A0A3N4HW69_ASCIM|nr:stress responsive A/B barrel domain-containing protein [Ascobolus immersus RN42]
MSSSASNEIVHIVLFAFKKELTWEQQQEVTRKMVALQDQCLHPETGKKYIKASVGGTNNSEEGFDQGFTHNFVVTFNNEKDRDYYAKQDPAHLGFVKELVQVVEKVLVVDFTPGVFAPPKAQL